MYPCLSLRNPSPQESGPDGTDSRRRETAIWCAARLETSAQGAARRRVRRAPRLERVRGRTRRVLGRSEEHTSELQSRLHLVCRLLLEKKKKKKTRMSTLT